MQGPQREEIEPGRLRIYAVTWNVSGMVRANSLLAFHHGGMLNETCCLTRRNRLELRNC